MAVYTEREMLEEVLRIVEAERRENKEFREFTYDKFNELMREITMLRSELAAMKADKANADKVAYQNVSDMFDHPERYVDKTNAAAGVSGPSFSDKHPNLNPQQQSNPGQQSMADKVAEILGADVPERHPNLNPQQQSNPGQQSMADKVAEIFGADIPERHPKLTPAEEIDRTVEMLIGYYSANEALNGSDGHNYNNPEDRANIRMYVQDYATKAPLSTLTPSVFENYYHYSSKYTNALV